MWTNDLTRKEGDAAADEDDAFEMTHRSSTKVTMVRQDVEAGGGVLPVRRSNRELAEELEKGFDLDIDLDEGIGSCDMVSLSCSGGGSSSSDVVTVTRTRTRTRTRTLSP